MSDRTGLGAEWGQEQRVLCSLESNPALLPCNHSVDLGKAGNMSVPQFPHIVFASQGCGEKYADMFFKIRTLLGTW